MQCGSGTRYPSVSVGPQLCDIVDYVQSCLLVTRAVSNGTRTLPKIFAAMTSGGARMQMFSQASNIWHIIQVSASCPLSIEHLFLILSATSSVYLCADLVVKGVGVTKQSQ